MSNYEKEIKNFSELGEKCFVNSKFHLLELGCGIYRLYFLNQNGDKIYYEKLLDARNCEITNVSVIGDSLGLHVRF